MNRLFHRLRRSSWLAELLAAALLLQALVPAGFMPTVGADGAATIKLCSAFAPSGHAPPDDSDGHGLCAFAGALHAAVAPARLVDWSPVASQQLAGSPVAGEVFAARLSRTHLARGPPLIHG